MKRITRFALALVLAAVLYADAAAYTYDDAGRLTSVTYPNGAVVTYTYDAAGNLTARTVTAAGAPSQKEKPAKKTPARKSSVAR